MPTLKEAREYQSKAQEKSIVKFLSSLLLYIVICVGLYLIHPRAVYVGMVVCFFAMTHTVRRTKIFEIFKKKEFVGKVTYFSVHIERIRRNYSGKMYDADDYIFADIAVTDDNGKTVYKTFTYVPEYDRVQNGDKATLLRFVDRPIIEFQDDPE